MIFMKPTYALCGLYENCKAHFGSSHSTTMVFTHIKALGKGHYQIWTVLGSTLCRSLFQ
jgi:hypothetical protein